MRAFRIPLRNRFRGLRVREGVLVRGPAGWAELSPFADYDPVSRARWLESTREAATRPWPDPARTRVPVNVTVPAVSPGRAREIVAASGCSTAKVKVGTGTDEARVEAVRDALGASGRLRVDANGCWDLDEAAHAIRVLSRYDLEYVEQPVASLDDMARLHRRVDVPLALDESIRTAEDPARVEAKRAGDIVVLKAQPLGGVRAALRVAEGLGLPVVVSSALETSVGLSAGLALAAALPELPYACGLATLRLLEGDVVAEPLEPAGGTLDVRRPPVDESALAPHSASHRESPHLAGLLSLARAELSALR